MRNDPCMHSRTPPVESSQADSSDDAERKLSVISEDGTCSMCVGLNTRIYIIYVHTYVYIIYNKKEYVCKEKARPALNGNINKINVTFSLTLSCCPRLFDWFPCFKRYVFGVVDVISACHIVLCLFGF